MDGSLHFPVATPPAPGETVPIAPGIHVAAHAAALRAQPHQSVAARRRPGLDHRRLRLCARRDPRRLGAHLRRDSSAAGRCGGSSSRITTPTISASPPGSPSAGRRRCGRPRRNGCTRGCTRTARRRGFGGVCAAILRAAPGSTTRPARVFAERQGNYRRGVPSVPPAYHRIGEGSAIEIGGREWRVIIGEGHAPEHACLYCAESRRPDRRRPDPAADLAQHQRPDARARRRPAGALPRLAQEAARRAAARHPGAAVAQSAVLRRARADRRTGGASPGALRRGRSPPAPGR